MFTPSAARSSISAVLCFSCLSSFSPKCFPLQDPLLVLPLSFSFSYPSFWSPKTSAHHHQKLRFMSPCCPKLAVCLPVRAPPCWAAARLPNSSLWEKWAGFTWRTALMLFSWWEATQGAALQILCLFNCAGPNPVSLLLSTSLPVHEHFVLSRCTLITKRLM